MQKILATLSALLLQLGCCVSLVVHVRHVNDT